MKNLLKNLDRLNIQANTEQGIYDSIVQYQSAFTFVESEEEALEYMPCGHTTEDIIERHELSFELTHESDTYAIDIYALYVDSGSIDYVYRLYVSYMYSEC